MKKSLLHLLLPALLTACALPLPEPAPPPNAPPGAVASTATYFASETPTYTATIPTSTFTLTPTLLQGEPTQEPSGTPVFTPTFIQLIQSNLLTPTAFVEGFVSLIVSVPVMYWGEPSPETVCGGGEVAIFAQVSAPARVAFVTLFQRLRSKRTGGTTDWDSGTLMENRGSGTFAVTVEAVDIQGYQNYPDAWIQMQFVSSDADGRLLDRTPVFTESLGLTACP